MQDEVGAGFESVAGEEDDFRDGEEDADGFEEHVDYGDAVVLLVSWLECGGFFFWGCWERIGGSGVQGEGGKDTLMRCRR